MSDIKWGIIGCGDVTEIKSGPAFNKVPGSSLLAVMRRDAAKAEDYARRHQVPKWYGNAADLLNDPEINAVYIATPPLYHEEYALAALRLGKPVYVEKPVTLTEPAARNIQQAAAQLQVKFTAAHYRRALPLFLKIKELIQQGAIGRPRLVNLQFLQPHQSDKIAHTEVNWRVDPAVSGGGLFHDMAPHQLDLMLYFFGDIERAAGLAANQAKLYTADDVVSGEILFSNGVLFNGLWCFTVPPEESLDRCDILGTEGKISFSVFGNYYTIRSKAHEERVEFVMPQHIQQPMIAQVVDYFTGRGANPCTAEEAAEVIRVMDIFTAKAKA